MRCYKLLFLTKGAVIDHVAVVWAGAPVALTAKEAKKAAKAEKKLQKHGGRGAAALATPTFEQEVSSRSSPPLQAPAPEPLMAGGFRSGAVDAQEQMRCAPPPPPLPPSLLLSSATVPAHRR